MEFLQLEYFMDAAVSENFSQTAKKYNVPPSNISQTIKRLEKELSVELFVRTSNKISLSDEGKIFFEGVKRGILEISNAKNDLLEYRGELRGEIKLLIETNRRLVTEAIEKFRHNFPDVSIIISHIAEPDTKYDIIVSDTLSARCEYVSHHLLNEPMLLACLKNDSEKCDSLYDFRDRRFITMGKNSRLFNYLGSICRECGFSPRIAIQTDDPFYVRKYVEMGLGVAIVPGVSWSGLFSDNIKLINVGSYTRNTYIYTLASELQNPVASKLGKIIIDVFGKERA